MLQESGHKKDKNPRSSLRLVKSEASDPFCVEAFDSYARTPVELITLAANCFARGPDLERTNPFGYYELGKKLQKLAALVGDIQPETIIWDALEARGAISQLLGGIPMPVEVSQAKAKLVNEKLSYIIDNYILTVDEDGKRRVIAMDENASHIPGWLISDLTECISAFETVLGEEIREGAIYRVPPRGLYSTPKLVDSAEDAFPHELQDYIPAKTKTDWQAAGRCLAFNLLSASGFHVARAVEGLLEVYYQRFTSKTGTLNGWNDYIVALEKVKADDGPTEKTLGELRQMKDDYRNPIVHPRAVLSEADAHMLFANGLSLIIAMAQELQKSAPVVEKSPDWSAGLAKMFLESADSPHPEAEAAKTKTTPKGALGSKKGAAK